MNISETGQIVIGVCILIVVFVLTRRYHAWRMARAYTTIARDLKKMNALDPSSAVDLPYSHKNLFRIGVRDHRPSVLRHMMINDIVGVTPDGKYYLKKA